MNFLWAFHPIDLFHALARSLVNHSDWIAPVVVLIIIGFFLAGLVMYLRPIWSTARALGSATTVLGARPNSENPFGETSTHLSDLWAKFLENRKDTTVSFRGKDISTVHPEEVFTEAAVLDGYNRHMAFTFAGFFTGLGILGTFLGLVVGLSSLVGTEQGSELAIGDVMGLLAGMHTAFYTSIAGIFVSLVWLFSDRTLLYRVHRQAQRFLRETERAYPVENADRILHRLLTVEQEESDAIHQTNVILREHQALHSGTHEILKQSLGAAEEQKAILQNLGTDIATAVIGTLSPVTASLQEAVTGIATSIGKNQEKLMADLLTSFQKGLTERLEEQFVELAQVLERTTQWQERVHGELSGLMEEVRRAAAAQAESAARSAELIDAFNDGAGALESAQHSIVAAAGGLQTTAIDLSAALGGAADGLTGISDALVGSVERIDLQARALEGRIAELDSQQEHYRDANEQLRVALATQIDAITEQVDSLNGFWGQFRDDLDVVGDRLRSSVEEFSVFTAEKLKEIFARFDSEMASVVQHLSGSVSEVREVTEELPGAVERFRGALVDGLAPLRDAREAVDRLPEFLTEMRALGSSIQGVAPVRESLDRTNVGLEGTQEALAALSQRLSGAEARLVQVLALVRPLEKDGNRPSGDVARSTLT